MYSYLLILGKWASADNLPNSTETVYCTKCNFNGFMLSAANKPQRKTHCGFHKHHLSKLGLNILLPCVILFMVFKDEDMSRNLPMHLPISLASLHGTIFRYGRHFPILTMHDYMDSCILLFVFSIGFSLLPTVLSEQTCDPPVKNQWSTERWPQHWIVRMSICDQSIFDIHSQFLEMPHTFIWIPQKPLSWVDVYDVYAVDNKYLHIRACRGRVRAHHHSRF